MATDYKQKEPTKNERMIYELAMNQNQMEKAMWSTSTLVITLAMLTGQDPEKIGELMVNGDEELKEYSKKINETIKKLEEEKSSTSAKATADKYDHDHSTHDHGHDHTH